MNRRRFLKIASSGIALSPWLERLVIASEPETADIRDLFESDDPEVLALTQRVFDKCILDKLRAPVEPLLHTWVQPGGPYYLGQWIWDTMFVVDLLSFLPDQKKVIRDIFQNYVSVRPSAPRRRDWAETVVEWWRRGKRLRRGMARPVSTGRARVLPGGSSDGRRCG